MFDADRPILKSTQDRLGRSVFTQYLARCILDNQDTESLVIGLYGGWGAGKTSVINLILEELQHASSNMFDNEKPIILNFSAWSYSGQNQLIYSFFRRLSSELRRAEYLENADKIIPLLELYVSFFTRQPTPKSFHPKRNFFSRFLKKHSDTHAWESGRDLTQVKAELNNLLRAQKHKIIIFIDNISRLDDPEIKQIFQIVKSMGDYANTTFILAMDKDYIIHTLNKIHGGGGADYLEKIVQLPFEIPTISKQDLEVILFDRLENITQQLPEGAWNSERWADIYYANLKSFFTNCRDITRYVNKLSFWFGRIKDLVNPVDLFAVVAISVFAPDVFRGVRDNKDLFTDLINTIIEYDQEKLAEDKLRCNEIISRTHDIPQEIILQLLMRLFPRLHSIYQTDTFFYHSEAQAREDRRVCCPEFFDTYFRFSLSTSDISDAEINTILSLSHDEEGFALTLLRLNQDDRIIKFLDTLDDAALNKIPTQHIGNVICALIDSADLFPTGEVTALNFNTSMRVHRIIQQLLRRLKTTDERFAIFREAIKKTVKSLYVLVYELMLQEKEQLDFTSDQLLTLQNLVVGKIIYWAKIGRLAEHPKLLAILYAWKAWGNEDECRQFVGEMAQEDRGLLAFLCAALKEPIDQAMTKLVKDPSWKDYLRNIEDFISVNILAPHAKMLFEDLSFEKLREREQLAILIFLDLINIDTVKIIPKTTV